MSRTRQAAAVAVMALTLVASSGLVAAEESADTSESQAVTVTVLATARSITLTSTGIGTGCNNPSAGSPRICLELTAGASVSLNRNSTRLEFANPQASDMARITVRREPSAGQNEADAALDGLYFSFTPFSQGGTVPEASRARGCIPDNIGASFIGDGVDRVNTRDGDFDGTPTGSDIGTRVLYGVPPSSQTAGSPLMVGIFFGGTAPSDPRTISSVLVYTIEDADTGAAAATDVCSAEVWTDVGAS